MKTRALLPALLLALAAGCATAAPAPKGGRDVTAEITHQPLPTGSDREASAAATGGDGVVTVRGFVPVPTPCYRLAAAAETADGALTLAVDATLPPDVGCIAVLGTLEYTATLRGVAPGSHPVRLVLRYPGTGWAAARLDAGVAIVR